jgi:hypothetical protein
MCETIIDHCAEVNCGAHGSCIDGSCVCGSAAYSGYRCQDFDACYGVHCGALGDCVNGSCDCKDRWSGSICNIAPLLCCSDPRTYCASCGCGCNSYCSDCRCDSGC